jgi:hypothetical protein
MSNDATKHQRLAFLFSLGALPIGGCTASDDDGTTNATAQTTQTTSGTTDASTGTDATTENPSTTGVSTTDAETGHSEGAADSTGDVPVPNVCQAYADKANECGVVGEYDPAQYCAMVLTYDAMYGAECVMAQSDYFACLAALDCAAIMDDQPDCEAESAVSNAACGGGGSSGGGSGSSSA